MQNKRDSTRKPVSVPAVIESGAIQVHGTIVDVSATGARVRLTSNAFLATQCTLTASLFGAAVPSRIIWRRGAELGLRFRAAVSVKDGARSRGTPLLPVAGFGRRL